jgi:hypothetical protein
VARGRSVGTSESVSHCERSVARLGIVMLDFLGLRNFEPVMFCSGILFFADSQDLNLYRVGETRGLDPMQLEANYRCEVVLVRVGIMVLE